MKSNAEKITIIEKHVPLFRWYSSSQGYFITTTPFVEHEPGLRPVTLAEYAKHKINEAVKARLAKK